MRLLITTQALDAQDPRLGFFVRWVKEFARHCESVTVICLRKGTYELPDNVAVYEIGPGNKFARAIRILRYIVVLRPRYEAVFVHMNPEYVVVAGWLWRLLGKKVGLWYTHKAVNLRLRIATWFANIIFTASKESFRLRSPKVHVMGHGIDTTFFSQDPTVARESWWLSAGRLDKSKRHDLAIRAAVDAGKELRILGEGPERGALEILAKESGAKVVFADRIDHIGVRDAFRRAGLFLHMSETGSLDKMILEAIACGCPVSTRDPALKHLETVDTAFVGEHHSLSNLIPRILKVLA
jgi:glycosyltransferase involved in cell wall biosynthesis